MTLRHESIALDARDPDRVARFWAELLGRHVAHDAAGALVPGADGQLGLRFVRNDSELVRPNGMHLHLTSLDNDDQLTQVQAARDLGARHLDVGQQADEEHVVLADPEGNAFCVIEPGNGFLAGTGRLGELTCDGTRAVGVFWSEALGWPLVWDRGGETAVQSPQGGTKISWSGSPAAVATRAQQHHRLVAPAGSLRAEVDRLLRLGATGVSEDGDGIAPADPDGVGLTDPRGVALADPDGSVFRVCAGG